MNPDVSCSKALQIKPPFAKNLLSVPIDRLYGTFNLCNYNPSVKKTML